MPPVAQWLGLPWYALVLFVMAVGWISQELSRSMAMAIGLLDLPNSRKIHKRPVPLSGGPGIFMPLFLVYTGWLLVGSPGMALFPALAIGFGFGTIFLTGLIDDLRGITARKRLVIQAAVAAVLWWAGFRLDDIALGGWTLHLGLWSLPLTLFWFMGFMNTSNLMDGMDGLSGGMNLIALLALGAAIAVIADGLLIVAASAVLLTGVFLVFNLRKREKVFLGDSGSLTLGLAVATLALVPDLRVAGYTSLLASVALLAYFIGIVDVSLAIIRRLRKGLSPLAADRLHLHHRLLRNGSDHGSTLCLLNTPGATLSCLVLALLPGTAQLLLPIGLLLMLVVAVMLTRQQLRLTSVPKRPTQAAITPFPGHLLPELQESPQPANSVVSQESDLLEQIAAQ